MIFNFINTNKKTMWVQFTLNTLHKYYGAITFLELYWSFVTGIDIRIVVLNLDVRFVYYKKGI